MLCGTRWEWNALAWGSTNPGNGRRKTYGWIRLCLRGKTMCFNGVSMLTAVGSGSKVLRILNYVRILISFMNEISKVTRKAWHCGKAIHFWSTSIVYIQYIYTGCFTTLGHNCRRWFPRFLWSKKFIWTCVRFWTVTELWASFNSRTRPRVNRV